MTRAFVVLALIAGCGSSKTPTPPPTPAAPDAAPVASGACAADDQHCCLEDGTEIVAYCAPISREGDPPLHTRNPDGTCGACMLRCLPATARIATPDGERAIASLHDGDVVWTADADGARIAAPILRVRALAAPATHPLQRVRLDDGRVVSGSAGHPIGDGRDLGQLAIGDALDGARVLAIDTVALDGDATWDLLPAGPTGWYWADGVRLASTLE